MKDETPEKVDYTVCTKTAKYCDEEEEDNNRDELQNKASEQ